MCQFLISVDADFRQFLDEKLDRDTIFVLWYEMNHMGQKNKKRVVKIQGGKNVLFFLKEKS